jgi:hypothetical protein
MNIEEYYQLNGANLSFTRQQASDFAKKVAGDFNPIHDVDSKRFCVPGDLLFSVMIHHYGLRQKMLFNFSGMVGDSDVLILPEDNGEHLAIMNARDKKFLAVECAGETSNNAKLIESLTTHYVEFSSRAFIQILVPLMAEHKVMINPDRPLIIYESMSFKLQRMDMQNISLELTSNELQVSGKRGNVTLEYDLLSENEVVGHGCKRMVLSGLREFEQQQMDGLVDYYDKRKGLFS